MMSQPSRSAAAPIFARWASSPRPERACAPVDTGRYAISAHHLRNRSVTLGCGMHSAMHTSKKSLPDKGLFYSRAAGYAVDCIQRWGFSIALYRLVSTASTVTQLWYQSAGMPGSRYDTTEMKLVPLVGGMSLCVVPVPRWCYHRAVWLGCGSVCCMYGWDVSGMCADSWRYAVVVERSFSYL
jgi:hypothetical protein